jgi:isoquinoline 1-oxidoreductase beta subunit
MKVATSRVAVAGFAPSGMDRRRFLKTGAAGAVGLVIAFHLPGSRAAAELAPVAPGASALNAWIRIATDNSVTIVIDKSEMGQGIITSLSMLAAEELECDWKKIRWEFAPADKAYVNPLFGVQGTGGSMSTRASWKPMSQAGASAREMLIAAAAQNWGVAKTACRAESGTVVNVATKARASYGSLAEAAARLPVPADVPLKDPKTYKLVGKATKRLDTPLKTNGRAEFGLDVRRPGMLHAVVERCPVFGGKVASFDATKAKAVAGVKAVIQISTGVAVVADNTWNAMQGRRALDLKWDEGPNADLSSAGISKLFAERAEKPGVVARKEGDAAAAMASAVRKLEAVYEAPYQAHVTMEPMNCTAHVRSDSCDVWVPTQFQTTSEATAARITGLKPEQIHVHTTYLGGGFGRRAEQDFVVEAVETSKAMGVPVQITFSREDDMQHDMYRPASYCRFSAGLDAEGWPVAWNARIASPSIMTRFFGPGAVKNGLDESSVEGVSDIAYAIPNILVDYQMTEPGIPVGFWRSVGASQNGFFSESFVDEVAAATGKDPYQFRRKLLAKAPRHLGVLELAATKAEWGKPLPTGRFRGIAMVKAFDTHVAEVAEIAVAKDGVVQVHRVVCAVDCGRVINPATVEAQMQSGIAYGLTAALKGGITIDRGRVQQSNFSDYDLLRMNEMPQVEVHIIASEESPTGCGEPGVPPVAPAVCNAIFAATGRRIRSLPIRAEDLA